VCKKTFASRDCRRSRFDQHIQIVPEEVVYFDNIVGEFDLNRIT
jgi:hypothetical protein